MNTKIHRGRAGEDLAVDYLTKKGYRILDRNYRYAHGEIDIVAEDRNVLVFIEVKARRSKRYGEPEDAITFRKRTVVRRTADGYIYEHNIEDKDCRFDVIAVDYEPGSPEVRHIENAF
jgi:putative endonuclease